jgi:hypothetical protein
MAPIRRQDQQGATLIEAAIILPMLIFILISLMEMGVAFKDFLTTDFTVKEGARIGSVVGNDIDADCSIVTTMVANFSANDLAKLDEIRIWEVSDSGNPTGNQNTWSYNTSQDPLDCGLGWSKIGNWPSTSRGVTVSGGLDIIGITIDTKHNWITGVPPWSGTMEIVRTAIQRLEPESFE